MDDIESMQEKQSISLDRATHIPATLENDKMAKKAYAEKEK